MFVSDVYKVNLSQKVYSSGYISILLVVSDLNFNYSKLYKVGQMEYIKIPHLLPYKPDWAYLSSIAYGQ